MPTVAIFDHVTPIGSADGRYTVSRLLATIRAIDDLPPFARIPAGAWPNKGLYPREWRQWFRACLDQKINRNDPRAGWRKMSREYQVAQWQDRRAVEDYIHRRIRCSGSRGNLRTPEMKRRYPHIDCQALDD
jgi:hypothetical protein